MRRSKHERAHATSWLNYDIGAQPQRMQIIANLKCQSIRRLEIAEFYTLFSLYGHKTGGKLL